MSRTDNDCTLWESDEYQSVRLDMRRPQPEYFSVTINVQEMLTRRRIRRINKMLREAYHG